MATIYKITSPSGKAYVGQTVDFTERIKGHKKSSSNCVAIKRAIDKYGWENMKVEVLLTCTEEEADEVEREMIRVHDTFGKNGYNMTSGGETNKRLSEETKARIGASMVEYYKTHSQKGRPGQKRTLETNAKIQNTRLKEKYKYKGHISFLKKRNRYRAGIPYCWRVNESNSRYIGSFKTKEEAELAISMYYDKYIKVQKDHESSRKL